MIIKKKGINVSFYLADPQAKTQSQVYVSVSLKSKSGSDRLRFPTGESFLTSYCHHRKRKGSKELLKKNTAFQLEYKSILDKMTEQLFEIAYTLEKANSKYSLTEIKNQFYLKSGRIEPEVHQLMGAFNSFMKDNKADWTTATLTKVSSTLTHLTEFEVQFGAIDLNNIDLELWDSIKNRYFVATKKFSNSTTNKYLSIFKQFLKYARKKGVTNKDIDFEDFGYLDEIEPFKIALKMPEVEALATLNLSEDLRLDKVRDLFMLEILTGQRFSDTAKLLDKNNISETSITIYQKKTNERVSIPLHPKLKTHLSYIFDKYPEGLPVISNQKFNEYLKEVCKIAGFNRKHSWATQIGKTIVNHSDFRYNLCTSHTGRRSFCTLALAAGINAETIMKVSGHKKYEQFRNYVKVDDADVNEAFENKFMI